MKLTEVDDCGCGTIDVGKDYPEQVRCYEHTTYRFSGVEGRAKYSGGDVSTKYNTVFGYSEDEEVTEKERTIMKILNSHKVFSKLSGGSERTADDLDDLVKALREVE